MVYAPPKPILLRNAVERQLEWFLGGRRPLRIEGLMLRVKMLTAVLCFAVGWDVSKGNALCDRGLGWILCLCLCGVIRMEMERGNEMDRKR